MNTYTVVIALTLVVIVSYLFNLVAKKTNIPSVLLLIGLGMLLQIGKTQFKITGEELFPLLNILGTVGLIMIVLEAALELEITRDKLPVIGKAFGVALIALIASTGLIALIIQIFVIEDWYTALIYAVPISIMSSAIIIPSVSGLKQESREFMVYESTFSDILGIMFFYFLIGEADAAHAGEVILNISLNVVATIVISVVVGYGLIWLFQRITSNVKLFLLIAVLVLLYAIGKLFHLSSLVIILVFGLLLANYKFAFRGFLARFIDEEKIPKIQHELHLVTLESAFLVRTFFFVVFGYTINLGSLVDWRVALISLLIIAALYVVRVIFLKAFRWKKPLMPELAIAPRGLITILLFFAIPDMYQTESFDFGLLLYPILITSLIMTGGLIMDKKRQGEEKVEHPEPEVDDPIEEETPDMVPLEEEEGSSSQNMQEARHRIENFMTRDQKEIKETLRDAEGNEIEPYFEVAEEKKPQDESNKPKEGPAWEEVVKPLNEKDGHDGEGEEWEEPDEELPG